jgi:hypothetical protein
MRKFKNHKDLINLAISKVHQKIAEASNKEKKECAKDKEWKKENRLELFINGHRNLN